MSAISQDAIAIADRMAPAVAREGFAKEWALFGRAIVEEHCAAKAAAVEEMFTAKCAEALSAAGFVTLHCNLTTGAVAFIGAPLQDENRIVIDGSDERERLAAYRGFCRLFGHLEQRLLSVASEVLIVTAPAPEWVLQNEPHPDGPCEGLRIIIVIPPQPSPPPSDDSHHADCRVAARVAVQKARISHYEACRRAAHVAVIKARGRAGKSTLCLVSKGSSAFGDSNSTLAEFLASSPPQDVFRVELSAKSFVGDWLPPRTAENVMLLFDADGRVPDWPRGVETIGLFVAGEPEEYWRNVLSCLPRAEGHGRRRSASLVSITAFRQANERPKWLH